MFEKASKLKLRFNVARGNISTEDLWDLSLQDLNIVAKALSRRLKQDQEEDFLEEKSTEDTITKLKFDLVIHVLDVKKEEKNDRESASERKVQKQKLMGILSKKQDESLEELSEKELKKKIKALG